MNSDAISLLLSELRDILSSDKPSVAQALHRITTFELMYPEAAHYMNNNPNKKVLILRSHDEFFVCDEYYPEDYGRVHILFKDGTGSYGTFDRRSYTLDWHKTSIEIKSIEFEDTSWPPDVKPGYNAIANYFGLDL